MVTKVRASFTHSDPAPFRNAAIPSPTMPRVTAVADEEHLALIKDSVDAWNAWRRKKGVPRPELSHANLDGANLDGADLSGADLIHANLCDAKLERADLSHANLRRTDLSYAHLSRADLRYARLSHADLSRADLNRASLQGALVDSANLSYANLEGANLNVAFLNGSNLNKAKLNGANLTNAGLSETAFTDVDLTSVTGLEACTHLGPSMIDHRTLEKSGPLPLSFLRGVGLPDALINYLPSLLKQAIQYYSCFISYSTKDQKFADRVHANLQDGGARCWYAPHDIMGGKKIHEQVEEAIKMYDRLLLILSNYSMHSEWVKTEIANARQREIREGRQVLFPIALVPYDTIKQWKAFDADTGKRLGAGNTRILHSRFL
jgi:uncharacterized protein YjbI with pentapeptide repeats